MGYDSSDIAGKNSLWNRFRDQFPVTQRYVYLNHAAVAPLVKPAADAMRDLAADARDHGSFHYSEWVDAYEGLRRATARLIGASRDEIAIVKNTSEGIATIAIGIDWRPGDKVVAFEEEFPANLYPWKRLENKGVNVKWHSIDDPLDEIDRSCRGARLLAVSFVNYLSGFRADLDALGEICHRHDCLFFVDAIQGMGAFPIDVKKSQIHALSADGHKWMLGPEGCGVLYVRSDIQDLVEPVEFGWTNVAGYADYGSRDMTLRSDAGRYECGTLNTIGIFGLRASIEFLLGVGIENVAGAVSERADQIAAGVTAKGYEVLGERTPANSSGIVSFQKEGVDSRMLLSRMRGASIQAAARQGWVRTSPHFYISPEDIDRTLQTLP